MVAVMTSFFYVPASVILVVFLDLLLKGSIVRIDLAIGAIIPILVGPPVTYAFARMAQHLDKTESALREVSTKDSRRLHYLEVMDRLTRISLSVENEEDLLRGALDLVLEVFQADRAWLLFPCDPDAPVWTVPMERTRPEWPGLFALGMEMPMTPDVAQLFREMPESEGVVQYGPLAPHAVPPSAVEQFSVKSQMLVVLRPKIGKPWLFGLHRCAEARLYDEEEQHLFTAIARRISDTLSSLLSVKQLRETEQRFRIMADSAPVLIWISDTSKLCTWFNQVWLDFTGRSLAQEMGNGWAEGVHPEDFHRCLDIYTSSFDARQPFSMEYRLRRHDGEYRWVLDSGTPRLSETGDFAGYIGSCIDITARKQAEEQLILAASVFSEAHEGITITDADGTIIDVNPTFCEITGYSRDEAIGRNPRILKSGKQPPEFYTAMWESIREQGHWQGEVWNRKKDGELYAELLTISALRNESGKILHYIGLFSDITQIKHQQQALELMAHYDALTKLPNRALFADRFSQAIARARRDGSLLAVCYLDLDGFKQVNDTMGHEAGDQILMEVALRIKGSVRAEDTVSRLGGDEFALLLEDIRTVDQYEQTMNRIHRAIAQPCLIDGQPVSIAASSGVTLYPLDDADPDTLLRHADQAMYQAKLAGRNRYLLFDTTQDQQAQSRRQQLSSIEKAFARREFRLHYQPRVNMKTGEVIGAEALIRWNHPERGLVPPLEFLPDIEGTPLEIQIGDWVIGEALSQLDVWRKAGLDFKVSVNISPRHLQGTDFVAKLDAALARHPDILSGQLELEVLESSMLENLASVSDVVTTCHNVLGVSIALDNFGTGYSSLTHLRHLPANTIKIDQSFVRDMIDDPDSYAIVEGVIGLANAFKREVIAEGVETRDHGLMLLTMDCIMAQGYGIARPMPAESIVSWARSYRPDAKWEDLAHNPLTPREERILLLLIESNQWIKRMEACLQSERDAVPHWPIMDDRKCHSGRWVAYAGKERLFDKELLDRFDQAHEELHRIGNALMHQFQEGRIKEAREGVPVLRASQRAVEEVLHQLS